MLALMGINSKQEKNNIENPKIKRGKSIYITNMRIQLPPRELIPRKISREEGIKTNNGEKKDSMLQGGGRSCQDKFPKILSLTCATGLTL